MTVALDRHAIAFGGGTSLTFSHTTSGADRLLVVFVNHYDGDYVTGVTYASAALTLDGSAYSYTRCYYKIAPALGANNVVVSSSTSSTMMRATSASWNNADQTTPITTHVDNSGSGYGTPVQTATVTCPTDGMVYGFVCHNYSNLGINTGTEIDNYHSGGGGWEFAHAYRADTGILKWNGANNYFWRALGIGINAVAAATQLPTRPLTILDAVHRASNW